MNIFDSIEKLITERASAVIVSQQLAFAQDQFAQLEQKVSDLQTQTGRLEAQLEREQVDHKKAREELQVLKDEHTEDIRIAHGLEFRRGKRTGGVWLPFCPACHLPAIDPDRDGVVLCTGGCSWSGLQVPYSLDSVIRQLG